MKLNDLKPPKGSKKPRKRVGRGESSGHGRQSGRGNKGALARSGTGRPAWMEGGQMPIQRRVPKKGFSNRFRQEFNLVNIWQIANYPAGTEITPEFLRQKNIIKKELPVKLLGVGEIKVPLVVRVHKVSKSAKEKIEKAGGKVEVLI